MTTAARRSRLLIRSIPDDVDQSIGLLVGAAAGGDENAWRSIVDRFARLVWFCIRPFGLDEGTAEDVFQTVWLRLAEHLGRIRQPEALASWLATTARREAIKVSQSRARQMPMDIEWEQVDLSAQPEDAFLDKEEKSEILKAYSQLSRSCRELLGLLVASPDLSYDEVARVLDLPRGSLGPTRARCLDRLRSLLALAEIGEVDT